MMVEKRPNVVVVGGGAIGLTQGGFGDDAFQLGELGILGGLGEFFTLRDGFLRRFDFAQRARELPVY